MTQPTTPPIRLAADLLAIYRAEAAGLGVSAPRLIATDIYRYRRMAEAAIPPLTERQWGLLAHVCDGMEMHALLSARRDDPPTADRIAAEIMDWMRAGGSETRPQWARELYDAVCIWPPLVVAGVLMRLRAEGARHADADADAASPSPSGCGPSEAE